MVLFVLSLAYVDDPLEKFLDAHESWILSGKALQVLGHLRYHLIVLYARKVYGVSKQHEKGVERVQ